MSCLLCFGVQSDELLIDIVIAESRRLGISSILHTHFRFCFQVSQSNSEIFDKKFSTKFDFSTGRAS